MSARWSNGGSSTAVARGTRWLPFALFTVALGVALVLVLHSLARAPSDARGDQGHYLNYMQTVHDRGLAAFPELFDQWNSDESSWILPPPSRVGFIVVSAVWAALFGADIAALQYLSIAAHFAAAIVNYLFARRHFGEPRALFIGVLWLFSPLLLGLSRLPLTESTIVLCTSLTTWLFLELVLDPEGWRARILFTVAFAFTVLVKELAVLLVVPFAAFVLAERFGRRRPIRLSTFALVFVAAGLVALPILVLAAGSLPTLLETTRIVLSSPETNRYALNMGSGPWYRYALDFLCLSPFTTLLAVAFLGVLVTRLREREYDPVLVYMALLVIASLVEYSFFTKNVRYAVSLELPLRALAVCMLGEIVPGRSAVSAALASGVAVVCLCWIDVRAFDLYWVRNKGYDPVTYFLLGARQMVPFRARSPDR